MGSRRRAKIVATLGPSSSDIKTIESLIKAGLNVARLNMSHGSHDGHLKLIQNIREASKNVGREVAILADLQGPKIRVSKLDTPLELKEGEIWELGYEDQIPNFKGQKFIPSTYKELVLDAKPGARVLFDDGLLETKVIEKKQHTISIEVIVGGKLTSNKGINLPDIKVSAPSLTEKDEKDLYFAVKNHVDYFALSFVREPQDILKVKYLLHKLKVDIPIVSKIEKPEAVENIDEIIKVTDVIMIARGDMAVEVGNHLVPSIQKKIIDKCNFKGVPVITATQMLESMVHNSRPTRAEASDVANAIWDGTDAVMLSGETATGKYPIETIKMMDKIVEEAEKTPKERPFLRNIDLSSVTASNQVAASLIAEKTNARWVLSLTQRGNSCLKMTRFRPNVKVLGVTPSLQAIRRMCLYWGITPYYIDSAEDDMLELEQKVLQKLKTEEQLQNGDKIVITHGDGSFFKHGTSNSVRVEIIRDLRSKNNSKQDSSQHLRQKVEFERGHIILDTDICASCQNCISVCPYGIWEINENKETRINEENAMQCVLDNTCVDRCPTGAIEIIPKMS
ncbi:MAG: pyruvate kinase [Halobacteriovoraceae bacterium]|nr:pyruvate kinase [Halobacteriovoraceae bacterium]MCB9095721.1 pyruvate kinase [Halobacteriovoraceae bacterium]